MSQYHCKFQLSSMQQCDLKSPHSLKQYIATKAQLCSYIDTDGVRGAKNTCITSKPFML